MSEQKDMRSMILRLGLINTGLLLVAGGAVALLKPEMLGLDAATATIAGAVAIIVGIMDFGMAWLLPALMKKGKK